MLRAYGHGFPLKFVRDCGSCTGTATAPTVRHVRLRSISSAIHTKRGSMEATGRPVASQSSECDNRSEIGSP